MENKVCCASLNPEKSGYIVLKEYTKEYLEKYCQFLEEYNCEKTYDTLADRIVDKYGVDKNRLIFQQGKVYYERQKNN